MKNQNETVENPFDGWVTINEASDITNRNHATVCYWIKTGKIRAYPVGSYGLRLVKLDEVKDYSSKAHRLNLPKRGKPKKSSG